MKVITLGMGYIGLPTAALIASNKISVTGVDINQDIVNTINHGRVHIVEPGLEKTVKEAVDQGFLEASNSPVEGDVYLIVVPTPFKDGHEPDISYIQAATRSILSFLKEGDLYIIESTSPVGTTTKMRDYIYASRPELKEKINIAYCPERVLPGNVMYELVYNDRVIGGIDKQSTEAAIKFYDLFVKGKLHETDSSTAEMCKLVENASRDVQIAFANELSLICDKVNINVWDLISLANKHPRVNILAPGCGVGGHCIAVDPYFIISDFGSEARIIKTAREINDSKALWCSERIIFYTKKFENENNRRPHIAICGLAFKPDIDDLRESPALKIATIIKEKLINYELKFVEPNINHHDQFSITPYDQIIDECDLIFYLVAHKEFNHDKDSIRSKVISFVDLND